jgi:hypothetical protein
MGSFSLGPRRVFRVEVFLWEVKFPSSVASLFLSKIMEFNNSNYFEDCAEFFFYCLLY